MTAPARVAGPPTSRPLTRHEMALLVVAARMSAWTQAQADTRFREAFGLNTLEFLQELNGVLQLPAAEQFDPHTVRRLRRLGKHRGRELA